MQDPRLPNMPNQHAEGSHAPIKLEGLDKHDIIDLSDTEWLPDAYDDTWEVDSDVAFNLDTAAGIAADTSMHLDLPYLPAASPPGCPHVVDLSQQRVIDAMCNGECALSRVDVLATILYNYDEEVLKAFLDVDGHSYVRLKINTCKEVPWATRLNGTGSTIIWRDGISYRQENPSSILIIRALDHVYTARVTPAPDATYGHTMVIHQRYKWKITSIIDEPWILESYDDGCHTTSWNICEEKSFVNRGLKGNEYYYQKPISQLQVPWLIDFNAGHDLLDEIWVGFENLESCYRREVTDKRIKKMKPVQKRKIDMVVRAGKKSRYDRG